MRNALVLLVALLALTACGGEGQDAAPETRTVTVKFQLIDYDTAFYGCEGTGGYSDIGPGTSVTIKNGSGDVLGAKELGQGEASSNGVQQTYCDWTVQIPDVPAGEEFYVVEVADRGEITSSAADLAADDWVFEVTLGEL